MVDVICCAPGEAGIDAIARSNLAAFRRGLRLGALTVIGGSLAAAIAASLVFDFAKTLSIVVNLWVHGGLTCFSVAVLFWIWGWRAIGAGVAAIGVAAVAAAVIVSPFAPPAEAGSGPRLQAAVFNALHDNPGGARITQALAASPADVVLVLEVEPIRDSLNDLASVFPYQHGCETRSCKAVLLSRHPIEPLAASDATGAAVVIDAVVVKDGVRYGVFGAHWTKAFLTHVRRTDSIAMANRIRAFRQKERGAPVIALGDFNAAPWDYDLRRVARWSELVMARRWAPTWPAQAGVLGLPIDHILADRGVVFVTHETFGADLGSNHLGVMTEIAFPSSEPSGGGEGSPP